MSKQTFCLSLHRSVPAFLCKIAGATLAIFGLITIIPINSPSNTNAEGGNTNSISVTASNAVVNSNARLAINKSTVEISASPASGYELYISTDEQSLYLDGDSSKINNKILSTSGTYDSPVAIYNESRPSWGYAIAGLDNFDSSYNINNPSSSSKFAAVPLDADAQLIASTDSAITTDSVDVYYGIKNNNELVAGDYSTTITYTALGTAEPPVAKAVIGNNGRINFTYDNLTYNVGDTFTDSLGDTTTVKRVHTVLGNSTSTSNAPWRDSDTIYSANVYPNFYDFKPASTAYWFQRLTKCASYTGLEYINTSQTTSMTHMFEMAGYYGSGWDIHGFDFGDWDVSKVTDMSHMFDWLIRTKNVPLDLGDLGKWNTGSVTNMSHMFDSAGKEASSFSIGDLSTWNTSNVTDMSYMFNEAGLNVYSSWDIGDIGKWNTGNVTNMASMFATAGYNARTTWNVGNLGYVDASHPGWDTGKVTNMSSMFNNAGRQNPAWSIGDISSWDVGNVTTMASMFSNAGAAVNSSHDWTVGNLNSWNTGKVTNMSYMFYSTGINAATWSVGNLGRIDASHPGWNVSKVTTFEGMFRDANKDRGSSQWTPGDLGSWDTSSATNMSQMFKCAGYNTSNWSIGNLGNTGANHPGWNTSKVTTFESMFESAGFSATSITTGDISSWDVSNATTMQSMFYEFNHNSTTWTSGSLATWNPASIENLSSTFASAGYKVTNFSLGVGAWNISTAKSLYNTFGNTGRNSTTFSIDLTNWNIGNVTNLSNTFNGTGYSATTWSIGDLSDWDTKNVTNMLATFNNAGYTAASWSIGDLNGWNTKKVTTLESTFKNAGHGANPAWSLGSLGYVDADHPGWDTRAVTNMQNTFNGAGFSATTTWDVGDLGSWNLSAVTATNGMFAGAAYSVNSWSVGNIKNWDVSKVINMSYMFSSAAYSDPNWTLDLTGWDVGRVTTFEEMFRNAGAGSTQSWTLIGVDGWRFGSNLSSSSRITFISMFDTAGYSAQTWSIGDLSGWTMDKAGNAASLFYRAGYSATSFNLGNLGGWSTGTITNMSNMFRQTAVNAAAADWYIGDLSNWVVTQRPSHNNFVEPHTVNEPNWQN